MWQLRNAFNLQHRSHSVFELGWDSGASVMAPALWPTRFFVEGSRAKEKLFEKLRFQWSKQQCNRGIKAIAANAPIGHEHANLKAQNWKSTDLVMFQTLNMGISELVAYGCIWPWARAGEDSDSSSHAASVISVEHLGWLAKKKCQPLEIYKKSRYAHNLKVNKKNIEMTKWQWPFVSIFSAPFVGKKSEVETPSLIFKVAGDIQAQGHLAFSRLILRLQRAGNGNRNPQLRDMIIAFTNELLGFPGVACFKHHFEVAKPRKL